MLQRGARRVDRTVTRLAGRGRCRARRGVVVLIIGGALMLLSACGQTATPLAARPSPTAQATDTPTPTPFRAPKATTPPLPSPTPSQPPACATIAPTPATTIQAYSYTIPLPPQTTTGMSMGATGEVITPLCSTTSGISAIDAFMSAHVGGYGWRRYDPAKDVNDGCAYVTWVRDHLALYWQFGFWGSNPDLSQHGQIHWWVATCERMNYTS